MRNTWTNIIAFAAGAAIGSAVTWKFVKTRYEKIAQEEIDSVKETFSESKRYLKEVAEPFAEGLAEGLAADVPAATQLDIKDYAEQLQDMAYTNYSGGDQPVETPKKKYEKKTDGPYVIRPEEFGDIDGYEQISLTYYADEILADDYDEIVDDVDDIVGLDSLKHFGEYDDDSVFVRNDERKCDYEILFDRRNYTDVVGDRPHRAEVEWDETD